MAFDSHQEKQTQPPASPAALSRAQELAMTTKNVVFIDRRVADYQALIASFNTDTKWILLDANKDGVLQMQSALAGYSNLDSIQIISHGSTGTLYLGSTVLDSSNLNSYQNQLQSIGASLMNTGDMLLYGCNVAQGTEGRTFIDSLAAITHADIAASKDITGDAILGGNWVLEAATGPVSETSLAISNYTSTLGTLTPPTNGLVAYYAFDDASNLGKDSSGQGNNGTVNGTVTAFGAGYVGGAALFGGASAPGFIHVLNSSSLQFLDSFSVSFAVKLTGYDGMDGWGSYSTYGTHSIVAKSHDSNGMAISAYGDSSSGNETSGVASYEWGSSGNGIGGNSGVSGVDKWVHYVYTFSNVNNVANIYINGNLIDSNHNFKQSFSSINTNDLYLGRYSDYWYPLNGALDEVRIYNRAVTENEVTALSLKTSATAPDTTAPLLVSSTPAKNTTKVAVNTNMTFVFNEDIALGTGKITVNNLTVGGGREIDISDKNQVGISGKTLTINPSDFSSDNKLEVTFGSGVIKDLAGNPFAGIKTGNLTFTTEIKPAPVYASGTVSGNTVTINFDTALDPEHLPTLSAYKVTAGGKAVAISSAKVSDKSLVLTLASAVTPGQAVSFSYTDPTSNNDIYALQGTWWNDVASINKTLTNGTKDTTAPKYVSSTVDGNVLTLVFDEDLSLSKLPSTTAFTVKIAGSAVTVNKVSGTGKEVKLTLAKVAAYQQAVQFTYTDGTGNALQDSAANHTGTLTSKTVTNITKYVDLTAPTLQQTNPTNGASNIDQNSNIQLVFSEDIKAGTGNIVIKDFTHNKTFETISIKDARVAISKQTLTIDPKGTFDVGTKYGVLINQGTILDLAGNGFTGTQTYDFKTAEDTSAPTAKISLDKTSLKVGEKANVTITFSEKVINFDNQDVKVSGGTLSQLKTTDSKTWNGTFTASSANEGKITVLSGSYNDEAKNAGGGLRADIIELAEKGNSDAQWVLGQKNMPSFINKAAFEDPLVALKYAAFFEFKVAALKSSNPGDQIDKIDKLVTNINAVVDIFKGGATFVTELGELDSSKFDAMIKLFLDLAEPAITIIYPSLSSKETPKWVGSLFSFLNSLHGLKTDHILSALKDSIKTNLGVMDDVKNTESPTLSKTIDFIFTGLGTFVDNADKGLYGKIDPSKSIYIEMAAESIKAAVTTWGSYSLNKTTSATENTLFAMDYLTAYYASNGDESLMKSHFGISKNITDAADKYFSSNWLNFQENDAISLTKSYVKTIENNFANKLNALGGVGAKSLANTSTYNVTTAFNYLHDNIPSSKDDVLYDSSNNDMISGYSGNDRLYISNGDTASGGKGDDIFSIYTEQSDGNTIKITDFNAGTIMLGVKFGECDTIDLSSIAKNIGVSKLTHYAKLADFESHKGSTYFADNTLYINTDNDKTAEIKIEIAGLNKTDFDADVGKGLIFS